MPDGVNFCPTCGNVFSAAQPIQPVTFEDDATVMANVAPVASAAPVAPASPEIPTAPAYTAPVASGYTVPAAPVYTAPAAPQPPQKKNTGMVIGIVIVSIIAVAAIVVAVLFGTGVIGGDKKEDDETPATVSQKAEKESDPPVVPVNPTNPVVPTNPVHPTNPVNPVVDEEPAIKKAAEEFVDILFISEESEASDLVNTLSFIMNEYIDTTYGTAEMRENFEETIGYDLDTYVDAMGAAPGSDEAKMYALAVILYDQVFGDWSIVADVSKIEIVSTNVEIDEDITGEYVDYFTEELAKEMGVVLTGGPKFSAVAEAEVSISVEYSDGTTSVEFVELGMIKENGQWKVFPIT